MWQQFAMYVSQTDAERILKSTYRKQKARQFQIGIFNLQNEYNMMEFANDTSCRFAFSEVMWKFTLKQLCWILNCLVVGLQCATLLNLRIK